MLVVLFFRFLPLGKNTTKLQAFRAVAWLAFLSLQCIWLWSVMGS